MKRLLYAVLLAVASISPQAARAEGAYMLDERPCPDQKPGLAPPGPDEYCDYVKKVRTCDGDLAERVFQQKRHPAYLQSENGSAQPRRLVCHHDDD